MRALFVPLLVALTLVSMPARGHQARPYLVWRSHATQMGLRSAFQRWRSKDSDDEGGSTPTPQPGPLPPAETASGETEEDSLAVLRNEVAMLRNEVTETEAAVSQLSESGTSSAAAPASPRTSTPGSTTTSAQTAGTNAGVDELDTSEAWRAVLNGTASRLGVPALQPLEIDILREAWLLALDAQDETLETVEAARDDALAAFGGDSAEIEELRAELENNISAEMDDFAGNIGSVDVFLFGTALGNVIADAISNATIEEGGAPIGLRGKLSETSADAGAGAGASGAPQRRKVPKDETEELVDPLVVLTRSACDALIVYNERQFRKMRGEAPAVDDDELRRSFYAGVAMTGVRNVLSLALGVWVLYALFSGMFWLWSQAFDVAASGVGESPLAKVLEAISSPTGTTTTPTL